MNGAIFKGNIGKRTDTSPYPPKISKEPFKDESKDLEQKGVLSGGGAKEKNPKGVL